MRCHATTLGSLRGGLQQRYVATLHFLHTLPIVHSPRNSCLGMISSHQAGSLRCDYDRKLWKGNSREQSHLHSQCCAVENNLCPGNADLDASEPEQLRASLFHGGICLS